MALSTSAALVADLVASRHASDRQALHAAFRAAIDELNADTDAGVIDPLKIQIGDEFQGRFATVGNALAATLRMRVRLTPIGDIRFGIGWGEVQSLDEDGTQDGPAWWSARDAIEWVAAAQEASPTEKVRTAYRLASGSNGPGEPEVNAALLCRDHLVGSLDKRSMRILGGLMDGRTQSEIADVEKISPSAVSQRVRRDGLGLLLAVHDDLGRVR